MAQNIIQMHLLEIKVTVSSVYTKSHVSYMSVDQKKEQREQWRLLDALIH
jgi:hypothetical protein